MENPDDMEIDNEIEENPIFSSNTPQTVPLQGLPTIPQPIQAYPQPFPVPSQALPTLNQLPPQQLQPPRLVQQLPRSNIIPSPQTSASSNYSQPSYINLFSMPSHSQSSNLYSSSQRLDQDEPFVMKPVEEIKELSSEPVSLRMSSNPNKLKLGQNATDLICTLSLIGLSAELEVIEKNREGLDLIFVVDISGSMGSGKIDLVKVTIQFVLTILKDFDRVSIIGFSDSAYIYCPLTVMNQENKVKVERIVQGLGPTGGTHIESGVRAALHSLADRKQVNQLSAIMLLSDGVDNNGQTVNMRVHAAIDEFKPKIQGNFKMHTFGYGTDHDSVVMNLMAKLTGGNFYYIENQISVTDAFSNCMGELVSLVANKIKANLTTLPCEVPFKLTKVFSVNEDTAFDMPDLFFDDQQDAVFILQFESVEGKVGVKTIRPMKAQVSYTLKGGSQVTKEVFLDVEIADDKEEVKSNKDVLLEYYRVRGAEKLKEITGKADQGKMDEAQRIGKDFQTELEKCEVKDDTKIKFLYKDIVDAQGRAENAHSWNSGGRAQVVSVQNTHSCKIASNNCVSYQKPMQAMYSVNSNIYAQSLPNPQRPPPPRFSNVPQPAPQFDLPLIGNSAPIPLFPNQMPPNLGSNLGSGLVFPPNMPNQFIPNPSGLNQSFGLPVQPQGINLIPPQVVNNPVPVNVVPSPPSGPTNI